MLERLLGLAGSLVDCNPCWRFGNVRRKLFGLSVQGFTAESVPVSRGSYSIAVLPFTFSFLRCSTVLITVLTVISPVEHCKLNSIKIETK